MAKTILITGASSGFGHLTASLFQSKGWNVVATMRSPENETELKKLDNVFVTRLDVTDPEPLPADHPLWQMNNVIITPHISWAGNDTRLRNMLMRENIRRYLAGEALLNVVDPDRGY